MPKINEGLAQVSPSANESIVWPRLFAYLLDVLLFLPLFWLGTRGGASAETTASVAGLVAVSRYVYLVVAHGAYGRTVGKALMGLKLGRETGGGAVFYSHAFMRVLPYMLLWLAGLFVDGVLERGHSLQAFGLVAMIGLLFRAASAVWFLANVIVLWRDNRHQAIHDRIAGTVVVRA